MPEPSSDPLIGRTVAHYEILRKLGGGAMGVVYAARDARLGRLVALKFLPPQWSHDDSAKQRFLREAQAASATHHRNICVIHDIEETDDGQLCIVMAHYEGETLKQRLERGPLPIEDAIEIGSEIAEGLARAHAQGVVHRDIKPGNLMLTDDGVKILDFGLAKFADALQLTIAGSSIGTASYMSPEQARGEDADARSDVWALGVVLFEMLTGRVPFSGAYVEATLHAIKFETVPPLRTLRPDVPEALERLVRRALDKDPSLRFESAREPARDLRFLAGRSLPLELRTEMVMAPGGARPSRPAEPVRRGGGRWIVLATVLIAAAGITAVWQWWPVERVPVVVVPVANHTGVPGLDSYLPALTESFIDEIDDARGLRVVPFLRLLEMTRPFAATDPSGSAALQTIAAESGAPFLIVPSLVYRDRDAAWLIQTQVRNAQTGTTVASYETDAVTSSLSEQTAFRLLEPAAAAVRQHFGATRAATHVDSQRFHSPPAARAFARGLDAYERLEYAAALSALNESASLDSQHALTFAWIGRVLLILNNKNEAIASAQHARGLLEPDAPPADVAFADAVLTEAQGQGGAAERDYRSLTQADGDSAAAHLELADYLKRRQDANQQAIDAYHRALELDPAYTRPHLELCQLYTRIDDHPRAEQEATAAIERYHAKGLAGGEAQAALCLGEAQREQGGAHLVQAEESVTRALSLVDAEESPYTLSRAVFYQGLVAYSQGKYEDASRFFETAAARAGAVGNRVTEGVALMNLGVINGLLGLPTRATGFFKDSRDAFLAIGDERRVAEADANRATLEIDHGIDLPGTSRTLANAQSNFERLGHVDFQLAAMHSEATAYRYLGALERARTVLRAAVSLARSRDLTARSTSLTLALAEADIQAGQYAPALAAIAPIVAADDGRRQPQARIAHSVVLTRLGRLDDAEAALDGVVEDLQRQQRIGLLASAHLAAGDIAYERGDLARARAEYSAAVASWRDPLPNAAAAEARCRRGLVVADARAGLRDAEAGLDDAVRTSRIAVIAECRLAVARLHQRGGRHGDALRALSAIDDDTPNASLGPDLRARVEAARSDALGPESAEAAAHLAAARAGVAALLDPLSPPEREKLATRREIHAIVAASPAATP